LTWTSSDPAIATVSTLGLTSGIALGNATVTVSAEGQTATANVAVTQLALVRIIAPTYAIRPGDSTQLTAVVLDSANHELQMPVTWSSADASVAMVSPSGTVSGTSEGVASITASADTVLSTLRIAVQQPVVGKIAFLSKRGRIGGTIQTQAGGIYLMLPDGSRQSLLIEDRLQPCNPDPPYYSTSCFTPWANLAVAPDGMQVAATSQVIYEPEFWAPMIHLCATAQTLCTQLDYPAAVQVIPGPRRTLVNVSAPAWSHDGTRIVFAKGVNYGNSDAGIHVWDSRTGAVALIEPSSNSEDPVWSPDGTRIAFVSSRSGNRDIWVMNADGSQLANLSNNPAEDSQPSWASDGTIAFVSDRDGNSEIYVMSPDGSSQTNLTHNPANDLRPDWSADSSQLVFQTDRDGNSEIYSMYRDGSSQTNLTNHPAADTNPSWGPPLR
jgi:dipeptidyl aminopeptidase/acylaminoacyl peptidase